MFQGIDFSARHDVLIRNEDGSFSRMDEPYFLARQIAPNTWQVLGDGDYSYLVAGEEEALVIDTGYGCGNIRAFCQTLTNKPVCCAANTHSHMDHTANNCYFEKVYMSAATERKVKLNRKPSLEGVTFPLDYEKEIIGDGFRFQLGNRELLTFEMPDHDDGSLLFLDPREHILFSGDEIMMEVKRLKGSVERFAGYLERLMEYRKEFDMLCTGGGIFPAVAVERFLENARYILDGHEGEAAPVQQKTPPEKEGPNGETVFRRRFPRGIDQTFGPVEQEYQRAMHYAGCTLIYDVRWIRE